MDYDALVAVHIVTDSPDPITPGTLCRQVRDAPCHVPRKRVSPGIPLTLDAATLRAVHV